MGRVRLFIVCFPLLCLIACRDNSAVFTQIESSFSGVSFNNEINENDSINSLDLVTIYNGGGVGIGDFDRNGLPDIYFAGNMVSNRLYLNMGDFIFRDVTVEAGVGAAGTWSRGVSIVDINSDGLSDIYVCNGVHSDPARRGNLLFINKGVDMNGVPQFEELSREYGLDVGLESIMASFFDYDNDGDLDMYLTVNAISVAYDPNRFGGSENKRPVQSRGKLFRNDWAADKVHPVFVDVSDRAGITLDGYGLGATTVDINRDGWKDIYVTNDFLSDNILYINNGDGTFRDRTKAFFKHTSYNAMGQDVVDINNDGLVDVVELDMSPEDNYRKKMMLNANNTTTNRYFEFFGYQHQYVRNTLQLNRGPRINEGDSLGYPVFSEIGFMSDIAETDWSWAPLVADFDNDGFRDIVVTNGFPKDVTDHDFIVYREEAFARISKEEIIRQIPEVKLPNYAFRNNGDLTFDDVSDNWGLTRPAFSSGAAVVDLDADGALDLVVSNINDEAFIYRNAGMEQGRPNHYLQLSFEAEKGNLEGFGAVVDIYYDAAGQQVHQVYEHNPYRGYMSTMHPIAHFGLGMASMVDSIVVRWPNGKKQTLKQVKADQVVQVRMSDAKQGYSWQENQVAAEALFRDVTRSSRMDYRHADYETVDFNIQTTLPHKLSDYCPALAVGDLDGDGLDDICIGGNSRSPAQVLFQRNDSGFSKRRLSDVPGPATAHKDGGILIFDADNDGHQDIYVASGGYQHEPNSPNYQDRLYVNDGSGSFSLATDALPDNYTSKLSVKAFDFNGDGKLDILVSGRVEPWKYPWPVSSFLLRNDSEAGRIKFTDVTDTVAPGLRDVGMVCDALFTDFDNDGLTDMILVGEWMPITFFKNTGGEFTDVTTATGLGDVPGWWNSIVAGDFRHTGRIDYVVGNVGLNTFYRASEEHPVYITGNDFDNNGGYESFVSLFLPDAHGELKEFPANGRDDFLHRLPSFKKFFKDYRSYALATMDEILSFGNKEDNIRLKASMLQSCFIQNDGGGKFTIVPLPKEAQISSIYGMLADDFDGDGNLDVLMNGNDFGTEVSIGPYDALNGLLLKGDGFGGFTPLSLLESGIYIPGDGRALVGLWGASESYLVAASQNRGQVKMFELKKGLKKITVNPSDVFALIRFRNGEVEKREFYHGTSFLSQSARFIALNENMSSVTIFGPSGEQRVYQVGEL